MTKGYPVSLDHILWSFCEHILKDPIIEPGGPLYEEIARCQDLAIQRSGQLSLRYEWVWGPIAHEDLPLEFPEGVAYDPEEDRLFFHTIDQLFYGLLLWYREAKARLDPVHPWLLQRAAQWERIIRRLEGYLEMETTAEKLEQLILHPCGKRA